jgi:hypothetical protein
MAQRADIAEFLELPLNAQRATSRRRPEIARARTPVAQPVSAPAAAAVESPLMLPLQA